MNGTVAALRYLGAGSRVSVMVGETEIAALVPAGETAPEAGAEVGITFDASALHVMAGS